MSPQRAALRQTGGRRHHAPTTWRPRQLTPRRTAPSECVRCGALVTNLDRHAAWHEHDE